MATTNRREVELALQVTTANTQSITDLRNDITKLAKEGGGAAPEFKKLADELDRLAKESASLDGLGKLAGDVDRLARAQADAADKAKVLTARYRDLEKATTDAATKQREIEQALKQANREKQAAQDAIKLLNIEQKSGTRSGETYRQELLAQQKALLDLRGKIREYKAGLEDAKTATGAARQAQNALSNEFRNATTAADAANRRLMETRERADDMARSLGGTSLATMDLVGAQARLVQSTTAVKTAIQGQLSTQEQLAAAKRAAALEDERIAARALSISQQQQAQAKAEADGILRDYARMEAAQKQAAATAKTAADAMSNAFGTVGAKSVKELEAKILETRNAMQLLATSGQLTGPALKTAMSQGEAAIKGLEREIRAATGSLTLMDRATNVWNQSMGGMKVSTLAAAAAISSIVQRVAEIGPAMLGAITANERLVQALNNIFKSSEVATSQISFLRQAANDAGVAVSGVQQNFVKFSAAMTGANIPLEQSNALFSQLTKASGSLGLSTDAVNRAMEALGQMASKGTVSMEELRQQLGDALPGALGIAAKGLGITEAQVISLVSSGQLAARDFFPAFTEGLKTISGEADTLSQNFERLKNGIGAVFIAIGDAGALDVMKAALTGLSATVGILSLGFVTLMETVTGSVRGIAAMVGTLRGGGSFEEALQASGAEVQASIARLTKLNAELTGTASSAQTATVSATANTAALEGMAEGTAAASKELLQLTTKTAESAEGLQHAATMAEAEAKALETTSTASAKAAKGLADVTLATDAVAAAQTANIVSMEKVATARQAEVDLLVDQFNKTKLLLEADGLLDESDAKRLLGMAQEIEKRAQVVAGINAKIEAAKADLAQSELEKQMLLDNSARLGELSAAYEAAKVKLAELQAQKQAGRDVDAEIVTVTGEVAAASRLLNDAHSDTIAKLQAKQITQKADNDLQMSALELQKAQYDSLGELGKALGNTTMQREAAIGKLQIQIEMSKANAAAMVAEADGNIAVAKATMAQLEALGQLDPVKRATIDAAIKNAEAQKNTAAAILETNKVLENQLKSLQNGASGLDSHAGASGRAASAQDGFGNSTRNTTSAIEAQNEALERNIAAQEKANELKERENALYREKWNIDKQNRVLDSDGKVLEQFTGYNRFGFVERAKQVNVDEATASKLFDEMERGHGLVKPFAAEEALRKAADEAIRRRVSGAAPDVAKSPMATPTAAERQAKANTPVLPSGAPIPAKTYNVTINGTTVRTASDADAQNLIRLLQNAKLSA